MSASTMPLRIEDKVLARFWSKVRRYDVPDVCWPWTGACQGTGYGGFKIDGCKIDAHVMSWRLAHHGDPVPDGMEIRHTCDARACVRPEHLMLGTRRENVGDCRSGDRMVFPATQGENHGKSVMTEAAVRFARARKVDGLSVKEILGELASRFGISIGEPGLRKILARQRWKHVA